MLSERTSKRERSQVKARVDRQAGGEGVQSIDLIRNSVSAEVKYTPWKEDGEKDTQTTIPDSAAADVKFSPQGAAVVTVEKTADQENVALNSDYDIQYHAQE